jgi:hypothetical protein
MGLERNVVELLIYVWHRNVDPKYCLSGISWNTGNHYNERKRKELIVIKEISHAQESATNETFFFFFFFEENLVKLWRVSFSHRL